MARVRRELERFPDVRAFFQSGSMVDAILNSGMPAPIDVQVSGRDLAATYRTAQDLARRFHRLKGVGEIYIPQDMNYPTLKLDINRVHAAELGLTQKDIVGNVITALNSNMMIAPNFWVDYKTGNDYFLTVQYYENGPSAIHNFIDLKQIPLRAPDVQKPTTLDAVASLTTTQSPTEIDHYQIQRVVDVYVTPQGEDLGQLTAEIRGTIAAAGLPANMRVELRGMVQGMEESFRKFALGFGLAFILLFLILVAQFRSFIDPFLIMLAIPMGFIGVLIILPLTHTTLNVMSLMGVLMLVGVAGSNSILIVDFANKLQEEGLPVVDAIVTSCRVRMRPILMTSLATIIGMLPMAMKLGTGGEQYTPMARAIIGGLTSSVLLTVFLVPAAYLVVYQKRRKGSHV
jgi:multidrug efflux pump subunit AcrB